MEPISVGSALAVSMHAGKKIFDPSLEYIGGRLLDGTKAVDNFLSVVARTVFRLGQKTDQPGSIPPRVLNSVIDEAVYAEDDVMREYLSGVLVGSYGENSMDDRGVAMVNLIKSLSTASVRLHWTVYQALVHLHTPTDNPFERSPREFLGFLPTPVLDDGLGLNESVNRGVEGVLVSHAIDALVAAGLINLAAFGDVPMLRGLNYSKVEEPGLICGPTSRGTELYLWATGNSSLPSGFVFKNISRPPDPAMAIDVSAVKSMADIGYGARIVGP